MRNQYYNYIDSYSIYTFHEYLIDMKIIERELPANFYLPLWDVYEDSYKKYCRETNCEFECLKSFHSM